MPPSRHRNTLKNRSVPAAANNARAVISCRETGRPSAQTFLGGKHFGRGFGQPINLGEQHLQFGGAQLFQETPVAFLRARHNRVMGTKGTFEDYPPRIYVEGQAGGERFQAINDDHKKQFEHPLWTKLGEQARSGGHGGMDFVMAYRLVECMHDGLAPDFDVYDAAAWSAPLPLTEMSVAKGSMPMKFPDFTRGDWMKPRA